MFNRAWLAGGIPRTACVAAYEPICAVSLADSYINRANPGTYDAAPGTAPTWSAELGWTGNAANMYLKTGIVPVAGAFAICRFSNAIADQVAPLWATQNSYFQCYWTLNTGAGRANVYRYGNSQINASSAFSTSGVVAMGSNGAWVNGLFDVAPSGTDFSGAYQICILARPTAADASTANTFSSASIQALYFFNVTLTPTQVRAVTDAMNMLPMRPRVPAFPSWLTGGAVTQFRKAFGLRTGSRGVPE